MTPSETAKVLAKASAFDQRTIGHADAMAWAEALDDVALADALEAVTRHYRESEHRVMPAHVRRHVEQIRRERARLALTSTATGAVCDHGQVGGADLHPDTGWPWCPLCRAASRGPIDAREAPDAA